MTSRPQGGDRRPKERCWIYTPKSQESWNWANVGVWSGSGSPFQAGLSGTNGCWAFSYLGTEPKCTGSPFLSWGTLVTRGRGDHFKVKRCSVSPEILLGLGGARSTFLMHPRSWHALQACDNRKTTEGWGAPEWSERKRTEADGSRGGGPGALASPPTIPSGMLFNLSQPHSHKQG